jgi:hypothetical protein
MNIDDMHFDRLVDDELGEEERRELLGRLDDEPGGWRRCALAFLEAQCWRQALGEVSNLRSCLSTVLQPTATRASETPALQDQTPALHPETTRRMVWLGRLKVLSAMAASFLAAMWIGTAAHHAWMGQPRIPAGSGSMGMVAQNDHASHGSVAPGGWESHLVSTPQRIRPNRWQMVTVSSAADGQNPRSAIEVPAVERDSVDEQWRQSVPPAIPDNVLQALARTGHQIEQQREFVPVPLKDGRQLVMPVDRVKVHYVGNGPY